MSGAGAYVVRPMRLGTWPVRTCTECKKPYPPASPMQKTCCWACGMARQKRREAARAARKKAG